MTTSKYMLFYNEGCSPKIKQFDSVAEAEVWAGQFLLEHQGNTDDNWVEMLIKGSLCKSYSDWARSIGNDVPTEEVV